MFDGLLITAGQTLVLFLLMGLGALLRRVRLLDGAGVRTLSGIVVNVTTPAIILAAFQCPFDSSRLAGLGWSVAMAAVWYAAGFVASRWFFKGDDDETKALRWAVMFSNCGFMGLPLEQALFGEAGVFYGIVPIAMFNLLAWTYGVSIYRPLRGWRDFVKGMAVPANVALAVALALFFLPWRLPEPVLSPIRHVAAMNTPLPMLVMGYYLGGADFRAVFGSARTLRMLFLRHLAIPALLAGALALMTFAPAELRLIAVVPAAAPVGALLTVFAVQYGGDAEFSTAVVSVSTLLSILTIPLVVAVSQLAFG